MTDGDDSNNGTSELTPWKTINRVNQGPEGDGGEYEPGNAILFKSGDTWTWELGMLAGDLNAFLRPAGSGTAGNPITIGSYGGTVKPHIEGKGLISNVLRLHNQQHWEITNLRITNMTDGFTNPPDWDDSQGSLLRDLRGIYISGNNGQTLSGFNLHNLHIHDVTGEIRWMGVHVIHFPQPVQLRSGVYGNTGWDQSKRTGGIFIEAQNGPAPTIFKDIIVENNRLERNSFGGFTIKQFNGDATQRWAIRSDSAVAPDYICTQWRPHENILVRGNFINQEGFYKANGLYITTSRYVLVEKNVIKNAGASGFESFMTDYVVGQFNDISYSVSKAGGADSNAIGPDYNTTNQIFQYNYIHHNGDGILLYGWVYNTVIIRYNVLYNNTKLWVKHGQNERGFTQVYNNIFYNDTMQIQTLDTIRFVDLFHNNHGMILDVRNNVFLNNHAGTTRSSWGTPHLFTNNLYYGVTPPSSETNPLIANPQFTGPPNFPPGTNEARWDNFDVFRPRFYSPLINSGAIGTDGAFNPPPSGSMPSSTHIINAINSRIPGANIPNNRDYALTPLDRESRADIGIFAADFTGLGGIVNDSMTESPVVGAEVTLTLVGGESRTANTSANGLFAFNNVSDGEYTLMVSASGFENSQAVNFTAHRDASPWISLTTGLYIGDVKRIVTGTISDSITGAPLAGVAVLISRGDIQGTGTTGSDGMFSIEMPAGLGFTVTAKLSGYEDRVINDITIPVSGTVPPVNFVMFSLTRVYIDEPFDNLNDWVVEPSGNSSASIVPDPDNASNNLLRIHQDGASLIHVYNRIPTNAFGIFTIETRMKRSIVPATWTQYNLHTFERNHRLEDSTPSNGNKHSFWPSDNSAF
jgi:hypothetical protein